MNCGEVFRIRFAERCPFFKQRQPISKITDPEFAFASACTIEDNWWIEYTGCVETLKSELSSCLSHCLQPERTVNIPHGKHGPYTQCYSAAGYGNGAHDWKVFSNFGGQALDKDNFGRDFLIGSHSDY